MSEIPTTSSNVPIPAALEALPQSIIPYVIETRNHFLKEVFEGFDGQPLPRITLEEYNGNSLKVDLAGHPIEPSDPSLRPHLYDVFSPEGERVGHTSLVQPDRGEWHIGDIHVQPHHGYGPATYLAILQSLPERVGLRTEGVLKPEAIQMWERMVAMGIAKPSSKGGTPTGFETTYR